MVQELRKTVEAQNKKIQRADDIREIQNLMGRYEAWSVPESIRLNAKLMNDRLTSVRVCDPAIGSGAFPVGLMTLVCVPC